MVCFKCKAKLNKGLINHIADLDGHIIIIKGVPADICDQCGEYMLDHDVVLVLEKIINNIKESKAEISVVNYSDVA